MKKRNLGFLAGAMVLAGLAGAGQVGSAKAITSESGNTYQATVKGREKRNASINQIGGLPLMSYYPNYGMSPKEYGMRFGHGNKGGKINRLRLSHNAKLKKRMNKN